MYICPRCELIHKDQVLIDKYNNIYCISCKYAPLAKYDKLIEKNGIYYPELDINRSTAL